MGARITVKRLSTALRVTAWRNRILWDQLRHGIFIQRNESFRPRVLFDLGFEPPRPPRLREPVVISCLPKSGTHLLINATCRAFSRRQMGVFVGLPPEPLPAV